MACFHTHWTEGSNGTAFPAAFDTEELNFFKFPSNCFCGSLGFWVSLLLRREMEKMARACKGKEKMGQSQIFPDFFKVYMPQVSSKKLLIPAAFIACIDKMLPNTTILKNRLGSLWQVKVENTETGVFFVNGWENFVRDNSLVFGDFLVFRYDGDRIFNFRIYWKSGCEKKDARASLSIGKGMSFVNEEEVKRKESKQHKGKTIVQDCEDDFNDINDSCHKEDEEEEEEEVEARARARAFNMKMVGGMAKPCGRGRGREGLVDLKGCKVSAAVKTEPNEDEQQAQETERALNTPIPANPSFMAFLRPYHIDNHYMLVPADFARISHLLVTKFITLRGSNGKEWQVRYMCGNGKSRLSMGWAKFVQENDLKVGDLCVFKLIQTTDTVIEVTILRQ